MEIRFRKFVLFGLLAIVSHWFKTNPKIFHAGMRLTTRMEVKQKSERENEAKLKKTYTREKYAHFCNFDSLRFVIVHVDVYSTLMWL